MYLFTRRGRLAPGNSRKALAWAADLTTRVNQVSGLQVSLNTPVFSEGTGSLIWATWAEDLAQLETANDKLQADDGFLDAADAGAKYTTGGIDDALLQLIHGAPDPARQLTHVTVVGAVAATGKSVRALELGVEIAQKAEAITGVPTLFGAGATGPYGAVAWISGHESIESVQNAAEALAGEPGWLSYLDKELPGVYLEDQTVTRQTVYRRIG